MDESLLAAYRATDYRVRLAGGGWASIRVDQVLPSALAALVGECDWGYITAWNPLSRQQAGDRNREAQRQLLHALKQRRDVHAVRAGVGVGGDGWRERSLFVVGPGIEAFDTLARRFGQHGYLYGRAGGQAQLRWPQASGGA